MQVLVKRLAEGAPTCYASIPLHAKSYAIIKGLKSSGAPTNFALNRLRTFTPCFPDIFSSFTKVVEAVHIPRNVDREVHLLFWSRGASTPLTTASGGVITLWLILFVNSSFDYLGSILFVNNFKYVSYQRGIDVGHISQVMVHF